MSTPIRGRPPVHSFHGEPISVQQLALLAGVGLGTMRRRLATMSAEEAVSMGPARAFGVPAAVATPRRYTLNGEPTTIPRLAKAAGCSESAMLARLAVGYSPEEAVRGGASLRPTRELDGRRVSLGDLAVLAGCSAAAIGIRMRRHGLTPAEALVGRPPAVQRDPTLYEWQGRRVPATELARAAGCSRSAMYARLKSGKTPAAAVALGPRATAEARKRHER